MEVAIKGLGEIGYVPDQEAYELPPNAITELQNFRMRNGSAEKVRGYRQVFDATDEAAHYLTSFATADTKFIVHATSTKVYADADAVRTEITGPAMTAVEANQWSSAVLSGVLVLNNREDVPLYWTGDASTNLAALSGWNATHRCRAMRAMRYHLVALGIIENGVEYPHRVRWSAGAEPGALPDDWDYSDPTNDAGQTDVTGDGVLVDALLLGESLILYKERSMSLMTWVGGNDVFSIQPLPDPVGMLAPNCGCVVPGVGHVVLTAGDVVAHAGAGARSILDGKTKDWLKASMDATYYAASFVVANPQKSEVWICFPERGEELCTMALIWNWQTGAFSKRDLPGVSFGCLAAFNWATDPFDRDTAAFDSESVLTFNDESEVFSASDRVVMAAGTKIFEMDSTDLADGASFTGYIERTGLSLDEPETRKHLKRMWIAADGDAGTQISVYFGSSNDPETAPTYESPVTFTIGTSQWVDAWTNGRFLAYKLSSTGYFRVRSIALEVEPGGMY
jgi:hypothetical protein